MMARTKRCDYCGTVKDEDAAIDWLEVEQRLHLLSEPGEYHFCDWACLSHFACDKVQKRAGSPRTRESVRT